MTDERQLERFREAVEEKKREAKEASENPEQPLPGPPESASDQQDLYTAGRPQDVMSPRDKNAGKGKKTADKWNQ
jgi:hypothetical protein